MAYQIGSACVSCGACADVCPVGAISQGDDRYVIDANACLDCGTCSDTCPNGKVYSAIAHLSIFPRAFSALSRIFPTEESAALS